MAVLGTALSQEHVRLLRRHADEAVLLFDSDSAGQTSASRSVDAFAAEEVPVRVATLPEGLDPDEFLLKYGVEAFLKQLEAAPDGVSYKLEPRAGRKRAGGGFGAVPREGARQRPGDRGVDAELDRAVQEIRKIAARTGVQSMQPPAAP